MSEDSSKTKAAPLHFVTAKEAKGKPKAERTEEQIRADMKASVRRNESALKALAKL